MQGRPIYGEQRLLGEDEQKEFKLDNQKDVIDAMTSLQEKKWTSAAYRRLYSIKKKPSQQFSDKYNLLSSKLNTGSSVPNNPRFNALAMDYQERLIALESAGKELHAVENKLAELEEKKAGLEGMGYYSLDEPKLYDAKSKKEAEKKALQTELKTMMDGIDPLMDRMIEVLDPQPEQQVTPDFTEDPSIFETPEKATNALHGIVTGLWDLPMIEQHTSYQWAFSQPSEMNPHFETVMNALLADVTPDVHRGGGTVLDCLHSSLNA